MNLKPDRPRKPLESVGVSDTKLKVRNVGKGLVFSEKFAVRGAAAGSARPYTVANSAGWSVIEGCARGPIIAGVQPHSIEGRLSFGGQGDHPMVVTRRVLQREMLAKRRAQFA